jgi:tRNA pseudouridine55 synthase
MGKRNTGRALDGILIVDKPQGLTSNGVVSRLKRWTKAKKVGHTGALDPMATGVLPIVFGEAAKFSQYGLEANKGYVARVQLGTATIRWMPMAKSSPNKTFLSSMKHFCKVCFSH